MSSTFLVRSTSAASIFSFTTFSPRLSAPKIFNNNTIFFHNNNLRKCPLPCGVLGADLGSSSALGASFSVSVLEEAQGSDACLLEPQTEYEVDGASVVDDGWMVQWVYVWKPKFNHFINGWKNDFQPFF